MKFVISLISLIVLTACQTSQGANTGFALSNGAGPEFSVTGTSDVSSDQLKKDMTYKAASEAQRRGYPVVALVGNSPVRAENGLYVMTASYRGLDRIAQAGNRQTLVVSSYIATQGGESQKKTAKPSKYGGGLFRPTTPQGRAMDAAMAAAAAAIFRR